MTTAKLRKNDNKNAVEAMGIEYCEFDIVTNKEEHKEESVASLEERILAHCLLLPYVMPNINFEKSLCWYMRTGTLDRYTIQNNK